MTPWTPIKLGGYELVETGLKITGSPKLAEADAAGRWLAEMDRRTQRWLGLWWLDAQDRFPETYSQLLDPAIHNADTLTEYARVVRRVVDWEPEVSFSAHQAVAALDRPAQRRILRKAKAENLTVSAVRQEVRKASRRTISTGAARGAYRVAYLDPEYGPDAVKQLEQFPMPEHLLLNAAVFLWCPELYRDSIQDVYSAWGVRKVGAFIWHTQEHGGPSGYLSTRHEHLLWLVRGRCTPDNLTPMVDSVVSVKAANPGLKPERFRQIINRLYDHGRKVEFFARREGGSSRSRREWTFVGQRESGAA